MIERLDHLGFVSCDFHLANIGLDTDDDLVKLIDIDEIISLDRINIGKCNSKHRCPMHFHCRSGCDDDGLCQIKSSNVQLLCKNILNEGFKAIGGNEIPGLRLSENASEALVKVIEDCSVLGFNDTQLVKTALEYELTRIG